MRNDTPQPILLRDYKPVPYTIDRIELDFSLDPEVTRVSSRIFMRPNSAHKGKNAPLIFDGEKIKFISATIDGTSVAPVITDSNLTYVYSMPLMTAP